MIEILQSERPGDEVPEKALRYTGDPLRLRHILILPPIPGQQMFLAEQPDDDLKVFLVHRMIMRLDDLLDRFRKPTEDVDVLGMRETADFQGLVEQLGLHLETVRGDPVDGEGSDEKRQDFADAKERRPRDEAQVEGINDLLEQHIGHVLEPENQPERVEFALIVRTVHGRDVHGDVALVIDVFDDLQLRRTLDDLGEVHQVLEDRIQFQGGVGRVEHHEQLGGIGQPGGRRSLELHPHVLVAQRVLFMQQLVELDDQKRPLPLAVRHPVDSIQQLVDFGLRQIQQVFDVGNPSGLKDGLENPVNLLHQGTGCRDVRIDLGWHSILELGLVQMTPEFDNGFHELNNDVAALHMALLAQEVNQSIATPGELIHVRGHGPKLTFSPYLIEINRK